MTINMELGMITPPARRFECREWTRQDGLDESYNCGGPWILLVTAVLLPVTYVAQIALWPPELLYPR